MGILDQLDKRRRTRIPIKRFPVPVEWMLKNATGASLEYLDRMAKSPDFVTFVNFVAKFKEYNVYEVYSYQARSAEELAYFRAAKVGELAGLDAIIYTAQAAGDEILRRKKAKEVKNG